MTPFRPAARAATASPRGQNIPVKPVGARMSGDEIGIPRTVVDWSRRLTSTSARGRNR